MASGSPSRATAPFEHTALNSSSGVVVLLMGETGVGKSHFINVAAGKELAPVCDDLTHKDDAIRHFILRNPHVQDPGDPKASLILIDTPGLDNYFAHANDLMILQNIRSWITDRCSSDVKFGGILYLHDITQDRGALAYQSRTWPIVHFAHPEPLKHLLLATGKWDRQLPGENFERREKELVATVWKQLLAKGAKSHRFLNTRESAWMILDELLQMEPLQVHVLQRDLKKIQETLPKKKKNGLRGALRGFFSKLFS